MNRCHVSWVSLGALGVCLVLTSACSDKASAPFTGSDDGGGTSASSGSSSSQGSSTGSSNGSGSGTGGATTGGGGPSAGSSSGSLGTMSGSSSGSATMTPVGGDDGGPTGTCSATMAAGAIPLATNFLEPKVIGDGGYAYAYSDAAKGGASSACVSTLALCGAGMTGAMSAATWGAGIGVNLNQAMTTTSASPPIGMLAATGSGISYTLSNLPSQGARIIIDNAGMDYCAPLSAASGTAKWADFNATCWAPTPAGDLSGAPATATHLNFQVDAAATAAPFDFCVTAVSFAP